MTIRARLKPVQDVDPKLICCEPVRHTIETFGLLEVELSPNFRRIKRPCISCGTIHELTVAEVLTSVGPFTLIPVEFCDLDEGTVQ